MRLLAISDVHLGYPVNREAFAELPARPDDWVICAGDVGETVEQLAFALDVLGERFAKVIWVPGNHELWSHPRCERADLRGEERYLHLVEVARAHGAVTPEDPFLRWPHDPGLVLVPLFLLYDYSFAPDGMSPEEAVAWSRERGIVCTDETWLHPDPWPDRASRCHARLEATRARLEALPDGTRTILVNHFPLRRDLCRLFRIPRFVPWCGTRATEDWHVRYRAEVVVTGHLHMRATDWRDGVRFEEVSLGYPRHWRNDRPVADYLREVWPGGDEAPPSGFGGPFWRF